MRKLLGGMISGRSTRRRTLWVSAALILLVIGVASLTLLRRDKGPSLRPGQTGSYEAQIRQSLFALLQPVKLANCTLERFGEPHDGGYLVCGNLLGPVQAAYSYGISGYDQFGCDTSRRFRIPVHEYDCFDLRQPACPDGDLRFHAECVGAASGLENGRLFDTMANQIVKNGDADKRLLIKMDVEGAEWNTFLLTPDSVFERVDQLVVEFHGVNDDRFLAAMQRLTQFFYVAHVHFNNYSCDPGLAPFPASAYEVLFVAKRVGQSVESEAARPPHPLDAPNKPDAPDCQVVTTS